VLPAIECGELIQQLIESYRIPEIQVLLDRLSHGWPNRPLWNLYKKVNSFQFVFFLKTMLIYYAFDLVGNSHPISERSHEST